MELKHDEAKKKKELAAKQAVANAARQGEQAKSLAFAANAAAGTGAEQPPVGMAVDGTGSG